MGERFEELLAELGAEHARLRREAASLRAESEALRAGWQAKPGGHRSCAGGRQPPLPLESAAGHRPHEPVLQEVAEADAGITVAVARKGADEFGITCGPPVGHLLARTQLQVLEVKRGGSIDKWNRVNPGKTVDVGDLIVAVNGVRGNSKEMMEQVKAVASTIELVVRKGAELALPTRSTSRLTSACPQEAALWPTWVVEDSGGIEESTNTRKLLFASRTGSMRFDEAMQSDGCLQGLVMKPESRRCIVWDMIRLAALSYDVLMMPMLAFLPHEEPRWKVIVDMVTTVFWTLDIPVNFFTAFHADGLLEMRPRQIARHYLRRWFLVDFPLVSLDWLAIIMLANAGDVVNIARTSKVLRICRALRVLRMVRVLRFPRWADAVSDCLRSEISVTTFCILRSLLFIIVASHFVACGFYFVGDQAWRELGGSPEEEDFEPTWVDRLDEEDRGVGYRYTTSLHWAITQFTPASMEVVPRNTGERVFAVLTILAAVVGFSCFLSSITQAMANLQRASIEKSRESSNLRKYITQNEISLELGNTIMSYQRKHSLLERRRVHEDDVQVFKMLPESVRCELHFQAFSHLFERHPLFERLYKMDDGFTQELCHKAAAEVSLGRSEELFHPGEEALLMYFARDGGLWEYRRGQGSDDRVSLRGEVRLMEVALWVRWETRGWLSASASCEAVSLSAAKFHKIASKHASVFASCRQYASDFQDRLLGQEGGSVADVELGLHAKDLAEMARACSGGLDVCLGSKSLPSRSPKGTLMGLLSPSGQGALEFARAPTV